MNNKQFTKALRVAMKYYDPLRPMMNKEQYMCYAIERARAKNELSAWQTARARAKIMKAIHPYKILVEHLESKLGLEPESEDFRNFWNQYL